MASIGWFTAEELPLERKTYNWISSVLVFDTLPLLALAAGVLGFVGLDKERLKFRFISRGDDWRVDRDRDHIWMANFYGTNY